MAKKMTEKKTLTALEKKDLEFKTMKEIARKQQQRADRAEAKIREIKKRATLKDGLYKALMVAKYQKKIGERD